ncbi:hypothetical protein PMAYCL1PPCAC_07020 [Pristionchus mayeri]|uniref:Secreted protein n=1 Tax=Pristionchus mayeri TaxID=1317129 RepID=A0AAN4ZGZ7_9BILA|nr:hypothetical protein PMAYCL1PPCAC_07020 [Pristionchus mayeri]
MSSLFLLFIIFSLSQAKPSVYSHSNLASSSWPSGAYCIMQAGSSCPPSFSPNELKLSVPEEITPGMTDQSGNGLIRMGRAGSSFLVYSSYDRVYTLGLTFCCKNN